MTLYITGNPDGHGAIRVAAASGDFNPERTRPLSPVRVEILAWWQASLEVSTPTATAILDALAGYPHWAPGWVDLPPDVRLRLLSEGPAFVGGWRRAETPDWHSRPWHVYVMTAGPFTKVGISTDPEARREKVQSTCPFPVELVAHWPGGAEQERAIHRHLTPWFMRGEWFALPAHVLADLVRRRSEWEGPTQ